MSKIKFTGKPSDYFTKDGFNVKLNKEKISQLITHKTEAMTVESSVKAFFHGCGDVVINSVLKFIFDEISYIHKKRIENPEEIEQEAKEFTKKLFIILGVIAFLIIAAVVIFFTIKKTETRCDTDVGAFVMSQNFVKRALKHPSSAKFPYIDDSAVHVYGDIKSKGLEICKYTVYGYVDSKNDFGIITNNKYTVDLEFNTKTSNWKATQVFID